MEPNPHDELAEHYTQQGRAEIELEIIKRLLDKGITPDAISNLLGLSPQVVNQVLQLHFHGRLRTPEDEELVAEVRKFAMRVIAKANLILDTAPLPSQIAMMRVVAPALGRMVGNTQDQSFEDAHTALQEVFLAQRVDPIPPAPISSASGLTALIEPTHNPDEETLP